MDPNKRLTAENALDMDYFWKQPMPVAADKLPILTVDSIHDLGMTTS